MPMLFLEQYLMLFPMVYLFFCVSLILRAGKWRKLFTENVFAFNLYFQHIGLSLRKTKGAIRKSVIT